MKKIVIAPIFNDTHLVKLQIPNIIKSINPDYILYNEGMFPSGPESTTNVDSDFVKNYTLDGKRGFDYKELQDVISDAQKEYKDTKIMLNPMEYTSLDAPTNYYHGCNNFSDFGVEVEEGDLIFPYEGDVFHHEDDADTIEEACNKLEPNQGLKTIWVDFIANQYYAEEKTLKPFFKAETGRQRRFVIKYGTADYYRDVLLNFMTQKYDMLEDLEMITYHYAWFRPGKYADMRLAQLNRDPRYWNFFLSSISKVVEFKYKRIRVRPQPPLDPKLTHAWIRFCDFDHPEDIKSHPNFIEPLTEYQIDKILEESEDYYG